MKRLTILFVALATTPLLGQATTEPTTAPATTPPAGKGSFDERYGVLTDRNIFLSERRRPRPTNARPSGPSAPAPETYVIRGIVLEGLDFRAYIESNRGGPMTRLAPGDTLARGKVMEIQPDAVLFALDGQETWVEIGHDLLSGKRMVATAPTLPTTVATTTQPVAPGGTPGSVMVVPGGAPAAVTPGAMSKEEEMRQRRRRSTGQ